MTTWQFTPYALLYVLTASMSLVFAVASWRLRPARGTTLFFLLTIATAIWAVGYMLGFFNTELAWKLAALRLEYLGIISTTTLWVMFAIVYTYYDRWLTRKRVILMVAIPVISYLLVLTTEWHPLFYRHYGLTTVNGLVVSDKIYGPAFYVWIAYAYLVSLASAIILIQAALRFPELFRGQAMLLILAAAITLVFNSLYLTGNNPIAPYDPSPVTFTIAGLVVVIGMRRYKFLDIAPVAHHLVFQNVKSGVIVLDLPGRIMELNPVAEQILDRSRDAVLGRRIFDLFPEYHDLMARFEDVLEITTEVALGTPPRIYELQIAPMSGRGGQVLGRIVLMYDITERRQVIEELDAYARMVAHDLKMPLGLVVGYIDLILEEGEDDPFPEAVTHYLNIVSRSSRQMTEIINSLLLLANIRNWSEINTFPVDMAAVVNGALARLLKPINEAGAEFILPERWPVAQGYAPWVEEIWANYISNAIKYGGQPPLIELGAEAGDNGQVRFWVRDNGQGMTPEEQASVFGEFSRLGRHTGLEGHGLGLSIVQRIVTKLGGTMGAESTPGEGSTFYFTLPVDGNEAASLPD